MDSEIELKPCPFCGERKALSVSLSNVQPDDYHGGQVHCGECDAMGADAISIDGWLSNEEEATEAAIKAWNTRAHGEAEKPVAYLAREPGGETYLHLPDTDGTYEHIAAYPHLHDFNQLSPLFTTPPPPVVDEDAVERGAKAMRNAAAQATIILAHMLNDGAVDEAFEGQADAALDELNVALAALKEDGGC